MNLYSKHIKTLVVILFGISLNTAIGQERGVVRGLVLDDASGNPMLAVNISADRRTGTSSEDDGKFVLDLSVGKHTIEFFYVGYEMVRKEVNVLAGDQTYLDIRLKVKSRMLDEVVVSAGK